MYSELSAAYEFQSVAVETRRSMDDCTMPFVMAGPPYRIGQAIIFFVLLSFLFLLYSSPNLSGRRYHTSTRGVALV